MTVGHGAFGGPRGWACAFLLPLLVAFATPLAADSGEATARSTAALEAFFRAEVPGALAKESVPGAAWVYMRGDRIVTMGATGLADAEAGRAMDATSSIFRMGSISKLFTAVAVMRLVEEGKLALDDEVSRRLPELAMKGEPTWPPVRVSHLLTHGGGFDAGYEAVVGRRAEDMADIPRYLRESLPPRVRPPGEVVQYCNHGAAILGAMIEKITGRSYAAEQDRVLFGPLGMTSSSFALEQAPADRRVAGYDRVMGRAKRCTTPFHPSPPVGGLTSTVRDMARFMGALLRPESSPLLKPATLRLMMTRQFTNHPGFPGLGYGFFEYDRGALRIVGHGGGVLGFACNLYLFPETGEGFFMATNSNRGFHSIVEIKDRLLERFFPAASRPGPFDERPVAAMPEAMLDDYVACYRGNRTPRTSWNAMLARLVPVLPILRIERAGGGRLAMKTVKWFFFVRERVELEPVGPDLFRRLDGKAMVAFRRGTDGRVRHMFFSSSPVKTFDRSEIWDEQLLHAGLLFLFGMVFLRTIWRCLVSLVWSKARKPEGLGLGARFFLGGMAVLCLVVPFIPLVAALPIRDGVPRTLFGVGPVVRALLNVPFVVAVFAAPLVAFTGRLLRDGELPRPTKTFVAGVTLVILAYLPFLAYWNFLPRPW